MSFAELQNYYERLLKEAITKADDLEDALKQAKEEGCLLYTSDAADE